MSLHGLILAGGKSSRMGRDKGALEIHGLPQVQYLAGVLKPFVDEVFVSAREDQLGLEYLQHMQIITDKFESDSPLNGILSAMHKVPGTSWLVVAVDMPNVNAEAVEILIKNRDAGFPATCFEMPVKGGPEPLFAIWEGHIAPELEKIVAKQTGHICPRGVLKNLGAHIIKNAVDDNILANLNTPEQLREFVA